MVGGNVYRSRLVIIWQSWTRPIDSRRVERRATDAVDFDENRDEKLGWSRSNLSTARLGLISIVRCHNPWLSLITQSDLGIVEIVDSLSRLYRVYLIPEGDGGGEEMKLIRCSKRSKFYLNLS